jgi:cytochrome c-type biogenesis protein CcmE
LTETSTNIGAGADDEGANPDLTGIDLTPRAVPERSPAERRKRRSYRNVAVLSVLTVVLGFVLYQALTSARVYYLNVDEAVARQSELGGQTFRMQGEVMQVDGADDSGALVFTMAFADTSATVRHLGDEPSDLFGVGQKVVVDGHWTGDTFESRQILLKHSEDYVEDNPDRLEYETPSTTRTAP